MRFPVRLLSDLHLGHDVCSIQQAPQLAPLLDGIGTLILNGDTLEARLPRFIERSQAMLDELLAMAKERNVDVVMVNGNHDPSQWPHDWLDMAGGKIFVTHGHVFLRFVSPWSAKLRYCREAMETIAAEYSPEDLKVMEKRFELTRRWSEAMIATEVRQKGTGVLAKLAMATREIWPPSRPWNVAKVWTGLPYIATRFVEEFRPAAKVVLFGHTHRAAWWRKRGRLLVNTGGFISFAGALAVDFPKDGEVQVKRIARVGNDFVIRDTLVTDVQ